MLHLSWVFIVHSLRLRSLIPPFSLKHGSWHRQQKEKQEPPSLPSLPETREQGPAKNKGLPVFLSSAKISRDSEVLSQPGSHVSLQPEVQVLLKPELQHKNLFQANSAHKNGLLGKHLPLK